jgi:SRSO17 transposase
MRRAGGHRSAMSTAMTEDVLGRAAEYFARIGQHLTRSEQRESFATYAFGVLADGERKSVEPIAARASAEPIGTARTHDRLLHFMRESPWSDYAVRREATRYGIEALGAREPITTWVIDDTGFLKQGRCSPGVQRQYTGSAGKTANCQVAVSLSIATRTAHMPIDFELFLPESWIGDAARRRVARIPETTVFKTKTELAIEMLTRARESKVPGSIVLADSGYGGSAAFRNAVRALGLDFSVGIRSSSRVWLLDSAGRRQSEAIGVDKFATSLPDNAFRRVTWREGSRNSLSARFAFRRIKSAAHNDDTDPLDREPLWLIIEKTGDPKQPFKFALTTLSERMTKKEIVRVTKERWKTEQVYQELKGELGLDHFEGRSYTGWNHHVSVVLCCYAFVVAERVRSFFPSARGARTRGSIRVAA